MTATEVIHELEALPPAEQRKVIQFAFELESSRQLSGSELTRLAESLAVEADPAVAAEVKDRIVRGFYGRHFDA